MAGKRPKVAKTEEKTFLSRMKDEKPGALPALVVLVLLGATLIFFDLANRADSPAPATNRGETSETASAIGRSEEDTLREQLDRVIASTQTRPFRAKVTTENGFAGLWSQDGTDYRFENAAKTKIIIVNTEQNKLWIVDVHKKIAHETPFDASNIDVFNELMPTLFLEGLSTSTASGTKSLLDVLPSGKNATLTFRDDKLPDRWEGTKNDGWPQFIDWEYVRVGAIAAGDFELWKGLTVRQPTPTTTATASK